MRQYRRNTVRYRQHVQCVPQVQAVRMYGPCEVGIEREKEAMVTLVRIEGVVVREREREVLQSSGAEKRGGGECQLSSVNTIESKTQYTVSFILLGVICTENRSDQ
jgi:hypothetical protein